MQTSNGKNVTHDVLIENVFILELISSNNGLRFSDLTKPSS